MVKDGTACFHCGESNPPGDRFQVTILGVPRTMCCPGCQAVAETIVMAGLEDHYQQRFACAVKPSMEDLEQVLAQADNLTGAELEQPWVRDSGDALEAILQVEGISCAACGWLIERHLLAQPGVVAARLNLSTYELLVRWQSDVQSLANIVRQLASLGYSGRVRQPDDLQSTFQRERKAAYGRLAVGGLGAMQAMMFAVGLYFGEGRDMDAGIEAFLRWVSFLVAIPVVTYAAWPFHTAAWRSLRASYDGGRRIKNRLTMDVPVSAAIIITFLASVIATLSMGGVVYFESVTMFVFFISVGRFLEMLVRHRAAARNDRLGRFAPVSALRINTDIELDAEVSSEAALDQDKLAYTTRVPLSALQPDDQVLVKPGATVPADGVVLTGHSTTDESFLTGESLPQVKVVGSRVLAGSINGSSPLTVQVTAAGSNTVFANIQHLQTLAQSRKPQLAKVADKLASKFISQLLIAAVILGFIWLFIDPARAVWVVVALLVASCPCAMTLATSAATAASGSSLAAQGFYLTSDNGLEALASVTDVVLDKTGTLTDGQWRVARVIPLRSDISADQAMAIAAALEAHSEHPLGQAFVHVKTQFRAQDVKAEPGQGLVGHVAWLDPELSRSDFDVAQRYVGQKYRLGKAGFACPTQTLDAPTFGNSAILLADTQGPIAWFCLQEQIRPSAFAAVRQLRDKGMRIHVLSGDQERAVARVAGLLEISHWQADCSPQDKLAYVTALQQGEPDATDQKKPRVMIVGDGVNDSPVMGVAQVSVAMSSGADLARQGADAILLGGDLSLLPRSLGQAQKTLLIIRQNLAWAVAYNVLILPVAAVGWVTPLIAAAGMSASSLLVVLNALRLNRVENLAEEAVTHEYNLSADPPESDVTGPRRGGVLLGRKT